jgi:hypothetical protein
MKKVLLFLTLSFSLSVVTTDVFSMACTATTVSSPNSPGDCAESPVDISQCGTAFSVTSAQMAAASNGCNCLAGGGCPIEYTNACGCDNYDCNTSTAHPSVVGTFAGNNGSDITANSIENNTWWSFQAGNTCTYSISVCANNCSGGGSPGAQLWAYQANGTLPAGTITSYIYSNGFFNGCVSFNMPVTAGQYYYIMLDGNAGASCNVDVTVNLGTCPTCVILDDEGTTHFRAEMSKDLTSAKLRWNNLDQKEYLYYVQKSYDGLNYETIRDVTSSSLTIELEDFTINSYKSEIYYKLVKVSSGIEKNVGIDVVRLKSKKISSTKIFDVFGKEYSENNLPSGIIIYVTEFEDGHIETRKEFRSNIE